MLNKILCGKHTANRPVNAIKTVSPIKHRNHDSELNQKQVSALSLYFQKYFLELFLCLLYPPIDKLWH